MKKNEVDKSRRSFFLKSTAALGTGLVSASAGAAALFDPPQTPQQQITKLQQELNHLEDKEALEQLHLTFTTLLENKVYDAVVELFTEDATVEMHDIRLAGRTAVKKLFMEEYKNQEISQLHTAHRRNQSQKLDVVSVSGDRKQAGASFHSQVLICTPIRGQSALADMARQQGMSAQSCWENGRYDFVFARVRDQWRISGLSYQKV